MAEYGILILSCFLMSQRRNARMGTETGMEGGDKYWQEEVLRKGT
jgi:hypothetical protein